MIGTCYWATGITVTWHDGAWTARVDYFDDGWCEDASTEGRLVTRYFIDADRHGGIEAALAFAIDTVKADAERLGIAWKDPTLYAHGDGEDPEHPMPDGWRQLLAGQAERLGWHAPAYEAVR